MKKILKVGISVALAAVVVVVSFIGAKPRTVYMAAVDAMKQGDYEMARSHLERLDTDEAEDLLSQLYFVPTKISTTYEDGSTDQQSYAYNRKGCLVKAELAENEQVVTTSSYTYTTSGQMLTQTIAVPDQEKPETTVECFYDEKGNLTCFRTYGEEGLFYQTQYTYDENNCCVASFYVNGNGEWERKEFTYDAAGRLASEKVATSDENDWFFNCYEYHDNGVLKSERREEPETLVVISYDEEGNCRTKTTTLPDGSHLEEAYTYNEAGLLEEIAYSDGRKETYRYDKSGNLTYSYELESSGEWREILREYKDGNLVKKQVNESDRDISTYVYKYNKKGLCVSSQYKNESDGTWYQYTYTYDRHGNPEKETYKAETGSYERTIKWKTRYYPDGVPQMIEDILEEYAVKNG